MRRLSLAGQLLVLQMGIVILVVITVAGVSTAQTDADFRRTVERRMLSSAETVSTNRIVKSDLNTHELPEALKVTAERSRSLAGATYVIVIDERGNVRSATVPLSADGRLGVGDGTTISGRSWTGVTERYGDRVVEAHVPVLSDADDNLGERIGYVIVGREYPSWWQVLGTATPAVLLYLLVAGLIGVAGSLLLARRVKRQTLGLEPQEISALVEQREAMLHGVREGVVGVDMAGRITFANDESIRLLNLERTPVGTHVSDLGKSPELAAILTGESQQTDAVAAVDSRLLVLNSMPVHVRDKRSGSVISMRDRTELVDLQKQLAVAQDNTGTLRSQVHEFQNRLHAISGMVELDERQELLEFIKTVSRGMDKRVTNIAQRVGDPAVAALLVAKSIRADELAVEFVLEDDVRLEPHSAQLSADLVTVVGNLIDNAFDALGRDGGRVGLTLYDDDVTVRIEVRDSGGGIDPEFINHIFDAGWTGRSGTAMRSHGWGLALTQMACQRHGGNVAVVSGDGARLVATLQVAIDHGPSEAVRQEYSDAE